MPNLYNPSYQDSFQPTLSPAARDENRRPYLNLSQPLTSMGRRQKSRIQTFGPNVYSPQLTFSPTYNPATQNFQVASHQEVGGYSILIYAYTPEVDIPEV